MQLRNDAAVHSHRSIARDERGVVAIEFALVLPLILMCLFLIIDFGRVFNYFNDANHIAAEGARAAAVAGTGVDQGTFLAGLLDDETTTEELRDGSDQTSPIVACIVFPSGSDGSVGDPITVKVTSTFELLPIAGGLDIDIHGEATMRVERENDFVPGCSS